ncbi:MarR family winged helix-turn-helix transcriptional regulator [Kiloniella sp. b19]|uniref:MarR family winged helix-turn-helix transcriptional regulator n=1 Tax=Kiloniella sp. GXU_MW_B19 TaxID=3141326 RepID=UPI0031D37309
MKSTFLQTISLVERLHRQCLEVVKGELDRRGVRDLNNIQALILYNIGEEELSVGELTHRGYYLGSNVSYNVKKMVENGYLIQERSPHDRRSFHVRASDTGLEIYHAVSGMFDRHAQKISEGIIPEEDMRTAMAALHKMQVFWASPMAFASE